MVLYLVIEEVKVQDIAYDQMAAQGGGILHELAKSNSVEVITRGASHRMRACRKLLL